MAGSTWNNGDRPVSGSALAHAMRRKPRLHKALEARRPSYRRQDTGILEVPTFQPDSEGVVMEGSSPAATDESKVEDAVRRMVEAAYT